MKTKAIKLQFYHDSGHGWWRIRHTDADKLGILPRISGCSYESKGGRYLYLEEDRDAEIMFQALKASTQYLPQIKNDRFSERSHVRRLNPYRFEYYTTIYSSDHNLFERLDGVERFIQSHIDPRYVQVRSSDQYPWGLSEYEDVLDRARDYIKNRGIWCYYNRAGDLIATNQRLRVEHDLTQVSSHFVFSVK